MLSCDESSFDDSTRLACATDVMHVALRVLCHDRELVLVELTGTKEAYCFPSDGLEGGTNLTFAVNPSDVVAARIGCECDLI